MGGTNSVHIVNESGYEVRLTVDCDMKYRYHDFNYDDPKPEWKELHQGSIPLPKDEWVQIEAAKTFGIRINCLNKGRVVKFTTIKTTDNQSWIIRPQGAMASKCGSSLRTFELENPTTIYWEWEA